jgi:hypothetical protein
METPASQKDLACKGACTEPRLSASSLAALEHVFSYHAPTPDQVDAIAEIRQKAKELALAIKINAPGCADTSAAIRKVREAMMTANAAIVLGGIQV